MQKDVMNSGLIKLAFSSNAFQMMGKGGVGAGAGSKMKVPVT
jgi:hypothetical protein